MTKYHQSFKQQVIDFYFAHHQSLANALRHFDLKAGSVRQFSAEQACLEFGIANSGRLSQWLNVFEKRV